MTCQHVWRLFQSRCILMPIPAATEVVACSQKTSAFCSSPIIGSWEISSQDLTSCSFSSLVQFGPFLRFGAGEEDVDGPGDVTAVNCKADKGVSTAENGICKAFD